MSSQSKKCSNVDWNNANAKKGKQLYRVEQAVTSDAMNTQKAVAMDRVRAFRRNYWSALRTTWFGDLKMLKANIAIEHI